MSNIITHNYNNMAFQFREDGYFNMTKAAEKFGKRLAHFWETFEVWQYLESLAKLEGKLSGIPANLPPQERVESLFKLYVESQRGRSGGTWAHPKLAIRFARWLDVRFAVWCDAMMVM